jgi:transposase
MQDRLHNWYDVETDRANAVKDKRLVVGTHKRNGTLTIEVTKSMDVSVSSSMTLIENLEP